MNAPTIAVLGLLTRLPFAGVDPRYDSTPMRQPVLVDRGSTAAAPSLPFTTVANWRQMHRKVVYRGETSYWSKHREFGRIMGLPSRVSTPLQLALLEAVGL